MRFLVFTFAIFNFLTMTLQKSVHEFEIKTIDGTTQALSAFKGKKMLFVNTASECGFTSQYEALQNVHNKYGKDLTTMSAKTSWLSPQRKLKDILVICLLF